MMLINFEYPDQSEKEHEASRVPNVGEYVCIGDAASYLVAAVFHRLDANPDNEPVAHVRLR